MISQAIVFFILINAAFAVDLNFVEDGGRYTEKITFSKNDTTIEYDVPQHGQVAASKYLVDYQAGYKVLKYDEQKRCYVMDLQRNEPRPQDVKLGLLISKGTFPTEFSIKKNNILPLYKMDRSQLSQAILKFCAGYTIIKTISSTNITEIEKEAFRNFQATRRMKRQHFLETYSACDPTGVMSAFSQCGGGLANKNIQCRLLDRHCVYQVKCQYNTPNHLWNCPPNHVTDTQFCCDMFCN